MTDILSSWGMTWNRWGGVPFLDISYILPVCNRSNSDVESMDGVGACCKQRRWFSMLVSNLTMDEMETIYDL